MSHRATSNDSPYAAADELIAALQQSNVDGRAERLREAVNRAFPTSAAAENAAESTPDAKRSVASDATMRDLCVRMDLPSGDSDEPRVTLLVPRPLRETWNRSVDMASALVQGVMSERLALRAATAALPLMFVPYVGAALRAWNRPWSMFDRLDAVANLPVGLILIPAGVVLGVATMWFLVGARRAGLVYLAGACLLIFGGAAFHRTVEEQRAQAAQQAWDLLQVRAYISYQPGNIDPDPAIIGELFKDENRLAEVKAQIRRELQALHHDGQYVLFDGLVTYDCDPLMLFVPQIAKEVGFKKVVVGIWVHNDADGTPQEPVSQMEAVARPDVNGFVDGYILGHNVTEGLSVDELSRWIVRLRALTGKPVSSTYYLSHESTANRETSRSAMLALDFLAPDMGLPGAQFPIEPREAYEEVGRALGKVTDLDPRKPVLLKMVGLASGGRPEFTPDKQKDFMTHLWVDLTPPANTVYVIHTGVDLEWKAKRPQRPSGEPEFAPQEAHYGLLTVDGVAKPALAIFRDAPRRKQTR